MAKIDRYNGNVRAFAADSLGTERTVFGATTQSDTLNGNITLDLLRGWGVVGVNEDPTKQDFNGLGFTLGQLIAYLHQQGVPEWNAAQEYYEGSVVTTLAGIYRLKNGGDATVDPDNDNGTNWELAPTRAQVDAKADKATTYTETEVNNLLNAKANISGQAFSGNISAPNLSGTNTGDGALAIGVGQTWQDVTGSRSTNTTYTNSTGKPIMVSVTVDGTNAGVGFYVDGVKVGTTDVGSVGSLGMNLIVLVPSGSTYRATLNGGSLKKWVELR